MAMTRAQTTRLVGSLYLLAGLPLGVFSEAIPTYLRAHNRALSEIGAMGLLQLPWSLKFLLGPWVDRLGTYQRWLGGCIVALLIAFLALAQVERAESLGPITACLLVLTCASALYDVTADAIFLQALRHGPKGSEAGGNGLRLVAYKTAMMVGGGGLIVVGGRWGWSTGFLLVAGLVAVCAVVAPWSQMPAQHNIHPPWELWWQTLRAWAFRPKTWSVLVFVLLYKACTASLSAMEKLFWYDIGVPTETIGLAAGLLGLVGTVGGALLGSLIVSRRGLTPALVCGSLGQAMAASMYCIVSLQLLPMGFLWLSAVVTSVAFGLSTAALMNFITQACDAEQAATQFALLTALYALTRTYCALASGVVAQYAGYTWFFLYAALLAPTSLLFIGTMRRGGFLKGLKRS
jgi:PAT family beta-lactamase induction signal transducer AmpG